jgi:hypothetical protein
MGVCGDTFWDLLPGGDVDPSRAFLRQRKELAFAI